MNSNPDSSGLCLSLGFRLSAEGALACEQYSVGYSGVRECGETLIQVHAGA